MTAILYKRLKVDNGIKIWHYRGPLVYKLDVKEMYQAAWKPVSISEFPEKAELEPAPVGLAVQPEAKKGVYRPPGARSGTTFTMVCIYANRNSRIAVNWTNSLAPRLP